MYCSECGAEIDDDSKFCSQCGKEIKQKEENYLSWATDEPQGICLKCGSIVNMNQKRGGITSCEHELVDVGITEKEYFKKHAIERYTFNEEMRKKYVEGNPEINEKLYNEIVEFEAKEKAFLIKQDEYARKENLRKQREEAMKPKCPTCGSKNIKKIGLISRGLSVSTFGLASNSLGKTFHCKNCGYKW